MQKLLAFIIGVILLVGGYFWVNAYGFVLPKDLADAYTKLTELPIKTQAASLQKTIQDWTKDPASIIPYPAGWRKTTVTIDKETFNVVTADAKNPPAYYVSTVFPKKFIPKVSVARCLNIDPNKSTDWCAVGDNAELTTYFQVIEKLSKTQTWNGSSMIPSLTPNVPILP